MADYGLKYFGEFSSTDNKDYRINIKFKNYTGPVFSVVCAGVPVLHKWETDDPKAPIKGSSVAISLLNENSTLPLTSFYANEDDGVLIEVYQDAQLLFIGFLVQDDCSEILIDATHEIKLSANDNLGLLRDVKLDAAVTSVVSLTRVSLFDIIKSCLAATNTNIGLRAYVNIHETTQDQTQSFLTQTYIDPASFMTSDTDYDNCYSVLEKIMRRFKATLFQSLGVWNIVKEDDWQYYPLGIPGFAWDENNNFIGSLVMDDVFTYVQGQPESGILNRVFRPYKYDKETFNYVFPKSLLKNADLSLLGALISDTVVGTIRYKVYQFPASSGWTRWFGDDSVIVVEYDVATGKELQRYVRQNFVTGASIILNMPAFKFNEIEVNKGDILNLGFSYKASANTTTELFHILINLVVKDDASGASLGNPRWYSLTYISSGGNTYYQWNAQTGTYNNNEPAGNTINVAVDGTSADITQWQNFDLQSMIDQTSTIHPNMPPMPADGLLKMYIVGWNTAGNQSKIGYIKDIKFGLTFGINDSTNVIGHTHTYEQDLNIKNKSEIEIYTDDSPRNSIAGTLFLAGNTGLIRTRTQLWKRDTITEGVALGEIITYEQLFWRRIPRTIIEGTVYGVTDGANHLSLLSLVRFSMFPSLKFVFGLCEIDYRNDNWRGTVWEIGSDTETPADLTLADYEFKYLYKTTD